MLMLAKKLLKRVPLTLSFILLSLSLLAQDRTVTGKITDSKSGNPIEGASVIPKGTSKGTSTAGSFVQENADPGFPSPSTAGWYKIILDFQTGKYTVTLVSNDLPQELYMTGDATAAGWTNTPPVAQQFSRLNSSEYSITATLAPGKYYKFLSTQNQWQPQFGGSSATGGILGANYGSGSDPDAIPTPSAAGSYKIKVNFVTNTYTVTQ